MKQKLFIFFSLLLFIYGVKAQMISGYVYDQTTRQPLQNVSVQIVELNRKLVTDKEGFFVLSNINKGTYTIVYNLKHYTSLVVPISTDTFQDKKVFLSPAILELEEVKVVASGLPTALARTSTNVTIIKSSDMQSMLPGNITTILATIPSVSSFSTGNSVGKPYIRGLGNNRVLIVKNGIRQEDQQWGDEHGVQIDENDVYKLEVYKNPFSLVYGSDALGGLIYVETNGFANAPNQFLTGYETNGNILTQHLNYGQKYKNGIIWNVNGTVKLSQDYKNPTDGYVLDSRFQRYGMEGNVGIDRKWGYTHITVSNFQQYIGIPEGERDSLTGQFIFPDGRIATQKDFLSYKTILPFQYISHTTFAIDNMFRIQEHSLLKVLLSYQNNFRQEFEDDRKQASLQLTLHTVDYNLQWSFPKMTNHKLLFGLNGIFQVNQNGKNITDYLMPNYQLFTIGFFGIYQKTFLDKLTWSIGARGDLRNINIAQSGNAEFKALNKTNLNWSINTGLAYTILYNWILKLNIGRGFRYPTAAELASFGAHAGTNHFEIGNANLKPEISTQADFTTNWNSKHVYLELSVFANHVQNYIFTERISNYQGADSMIDDNFIYRYAQNDAFLYGVEAVVDIHPHPIDWLHFQNTFSWIRGIFTKRIDNTTNMPLIMQPRWVTDLTFTFLKHQLHFRNLYINLQSDYNFPQNNAFTAYNTETSTLSYWLMNATAGVDFYAQKTKCFSLYLFAKNIFNKGYQNHLSRLKYLSENYNNGKIGVFEPGFNFGIKAILYLP